MNFEIKEGSRVRIVEKFHAWHNKVGIVIERRVIKSTPQITYYSYWVKLDVPLGQRSSKIYGFAAVDLELYDILEETIRVIDES